MNQDLKTELKAKWFNDYCVLVESPVRSFYRIFGTYDDAKKEHDRIQRNCDLLKPCTVRMFLIDGAL